VICFKIIVLSYWILIKVFENKTFTYIKYSFIYFKYNKIKNYYKEYLILIFIIFDNYRRIFIRVINILIIFDINK